MQRYEFSNYSYDKLKELLDIVETCSPMNENDLNVAIWKKILPVNKEYIQKIREHSSNDNNMINDDQEHGPMDIVNIDRDEKNINERDVAEVDSCIQQETSNEDTNDDSVESNLLEIRNLLLDEEYDQIIQILTLYNNTQLDTIFKDIKDQSNVVIFGNVLAKCSNSLAVSSYCNIILLEQISFGSQTISETFEDFFTNHASIITQTLVKCLIDLPEDSKISRECLNYWKQLTNEHKIHMLSMFINQSTHINALHLSVIANLLHNKMDLLLTKKLLNLLTQNSCQLTNSKQFGLLLQTIILNSSKYLYPLIDHVKSLINMVHGIFKLKLLKLLQIYQEENSNNSFSQTIDF